MEPRDSSGENRTERKKRETRQKIISVSLNLFGRQGFDNTTMEQIAQEADIARKTLYNHFPVKEAIVDQYVREISTDFARQALEIIKDLPDTRSRLLAALDKAYQWVEDNPELTGICLVYRLKNNLYKRPRGKDGETGTRILISEIIGLGQERGEIRGDFPVQLLAAQIDILRGTVVMDWLNDTSRFDLRREMVRVVDLFLDGAANRQGPDG